EVGEREHAVDAGGGDVADRDRNLGAARLRAQTGDHRLGEVDALYAHASPGERERDPARSDRELERGAAAGRGGEEVDGRLDHGRVERFLLGLVVPGRDLLAEVVLGHAATVAERRAAA